MAGLSEMPFIRRLTRQTEDSIEDDVIELQ